MSKEKISRKKLLNEPDEFISTSQQVWLWVHEHRSGAGAIAGGILGAILVVLLAKAYVDSSREKRAEAVAAAVTRYGQAAAGKVPADLAQEFSGLAKKYAGSDEGAVARYFEAGALAAAGEAEKARQIYRELAAAGGKHADLATLSGVALAYLELAQGGQDAALAAFQSLLAGKDTALPRAQIMLEIALIHETRGKTAEALQVYREIAAAHPDGSWAEKVKERLRVLGERGPSAS